MKGGGLWVVGDASTGSATEALRPKLRNRGSATVVRDGVLIVFDNFCDDEI